MLVTITFPYRNQMKASEIDQEKFYIHKKVFPAQGGRVLHFGDYRLSKSIE